MLIQKTFTEALEAYNNQTPLTLDRIISDFDYTTFHVSNSINEKSCLQLSIKSKATYSLSKCGPDLSGFLQQKYDSQSGVSLSSTEPGYDFTLIVDLSQLTSEAIVQLSLFKIIIMSYPFYMAFADNVRLSQLNEIEQTEESNKSKVNTIQYRDDENIYIKPSADRVTVIFETLFQDETDKVFGKVFLQEFVDARKRNKSIQSAPQVLFSHEPPLEISNIVPHHQESKSSRRFITFVLFPRHFATQDLQFSSISQLVLFRNYFHYHIKCAKAYMHSRMRYRVDTFIKVLNRAKVDEDQDDSSENRRTITGRKMVY